MADTANLPRWQSHKIVHAAPIVKIEGDIITLDVGLPGGHDDVRAAPKMFERYRPVPGDYYVVYDDGYASISPKKAFEEGYHRAPAAGATDRMLQFFAYAHLPPHLQAESRPFSDLAHQIVATLPANPERTVALRKLVEAKDCAVRARLYKEG